MNNLEISQEALKRAKNWYQSAIRGFEDKRWNDVIYSCQMSAEQALKAILILFCIEYPKKHDVSNVYLNLKKQSIPKWFLDKINYHSKILRELVKKRGFSSYGYIDGMTNEDFKEDALKYKEPVKRIINDCEKLVIEFSKIQKFMKN